MRLHCMLEGGDKQKLATIDIKTIRECLHNLEIYFCMNPHKQQILTEIKNAISLLILD